MAIKFKANVPVQINPGRPEEKHVLVFEHPVVRDAYRVIHAANRVHRFRFHHVVGFVADSALRAGQGVGVLVHGVAVSQVNRFQR